METPCLEREKWAEMWPYAGEVLGGGLRALCAKPTGKGAAGRSSVAPLTHGCSGEGRARGWAEGLMGTCGTWGRFAQAAGLLIRSSYRDLCAQASGGRARPPRGPVPRETRPKGRELGLCWDAHHRTWRNVESLSGPSSPWGPVKPLCPSLLDETQG